jgi:hypothetical protein
MSEQLDCDDSMFLYDAWMAQAKTIRNYVSRNKKLEEEIQQLRDTLQLTVGYLNLNDPHERHAFNEARILFKELRND